MQTTDKFNDYLFATLPEQYPIASIPWSLKMTDAHRKEVLFQQSKFLDAAAQYSAEQPWVSFIAVTKHDCLLKTYGINTGAFHEITDKEYFESVQSNASDILNESSQRLDDEARANCKRLVDLQLNWTPLKRAFDAVKAAQYKEIQSFEPPLEPPEPPDLTKRIERSLGCAMGAAYFAIITGLIIGWAAVVLVDDGFVLFRTVGLLIAGLFLFLGIRMAVWDKSEKKKEEKYRDKYEKYRDEYESFSMLREEFYSSANEFFGPLGFDANAAAANLPACLEILQGHLEDRKTLEEAYLQV